MNLGFRTTIDKRPTYFVERILANWNAVPVNGELSAIIVNDKGYIDYDKVANLPVKIHTIREDKTNRWDVGTKIHFVINSRTKNRFQFAPVVLVKSIQSFEIKYYKKNGANKVDILVDGASVSLNLLAQNDGFDSTGEFLDYFNTNFKGKIIHWTDFEY